MNNYLPGFILSFLILMSCSDNGTDNNATGSFDRKALLTNMADNLIIPAYTQMETQTDISIVIFQTFCSNPQIASLEDARTAWKNAALTWQRANAFNFGPAGESGIRKTLVEEAGTFPVSTQKIESYISAADTAFNNFDRDSRGLYAIEYLLFQTGKTDVEIIQSFSDNNRKNYLMAMIRRMKQQVGAVTTGWVAYRQSFIDNDGTDIGSSTSYLYNEFLKSYEGLKNFKFGIPLGKRPGQVSPLPNNVEALYSGMSTELAMAHWNTIKSIWEGQSLSGTDGVGFREYLNSVAGGPELVSSTLAQMAQTDAAFGALPPGRLSELIGTQFSAVDLVHTELQKTTRFFKSDLSSLIGISVTFSSGDGD